MRCTSSGPCAKKMVFMVHMVCRICVCECVYIYIYIYMYYICSIQYLIGGLVYLVSIHVY